MTNEQLLFILLSYDAECLYDSDLDDATGTTYFSNAKHSYWARNLLRKYLESQGINLPRPASQPSSELEKLVEKLNLMGQKTHEQDGQQLDVPDIV